MWVVQSSFVLIMWLACTRSCHTPKLLFEVRRPCGLSRPLGGRIALRVLCGTHFGIDQPSVMLCKVPTAQFCKHSTFPIHSAVHITDTPLHTQQCIGHLAAPVHTRMRICCEVCSIYTSAARASLRKHRTQPDVASTVELDMVFWSGWVTLSWR